MTKALASKIATLAGEMQGDGREKLVANWRYLAKPLENCSTTNQILGMWINTCADELAALPAFDQGRFAGEVANVLREEFAPLINEWRHQHSMFGGDCDLCATQLERVLSRLAATPEQK